MLVVVVIIIRGRSLIVDRLELLLQFFLTPASGFDLGSARCQLGLLLLGLGKCGLLLALLFLFPELALANLFLQRLEPSFGRVVLPRELILFLFGLLSRVESMSACVRTCGAASISLQ